MRIVYCTTVFKNKWKVVSDLYEWNETIQKIINWIEENLEENPSLARATFEIRDTNKRLLHTARTQYLFQYPYGKLYTFLDIIPVKENRK